MLILEILVVPRIYSANLLTNFQVVVWSYLNGSKNSGAANIKNSLLFIITFQYIPRMVRTFPLTTELRRTAGIFAETAWAGAVYYLIWYMLAGHVSN